MKYKFLLLLPLLILTGCKTYSRDFDCPDARGGSCKSMGEINSLITSGQIKEYTGEVMTGANCRCRGFKGKARRR
jgi:hypothetical protein